MTQRRNVARGFRPNEARDFSPAKHRTLQVFAELKPRATLCLLLATIASATTHAQDTPKPPLPLEVYFSAPTEGEADVRLGVTIRVQFSRDVDPVSLDKRVRLTYSAAESAERGEAQPPVVEFTTKYVADSRALEIKPTRSLERFRQVKLELLEGVVGTDGSVLRPWALNFSTGGS